MILQTLQYVSHPQNKTRKSHTSKYSRYRYKFMFKEAAESSRRRQQYTTDILFKHTWVRILLVDMTISQRFLYPYGCCTAFPPTPFVYISIPHAVLHHYICIQRTSMHPLSLVLNINSTLVRNTQTELSTRIGCSNTL